METRKSTALGPISPFFIVADLPRATSFYVDRLGFEIRCLVPEDEPFFAIVGRDQVQILLKAVSDTVAAQPNPSRHPWAPWDSFVYVEQPDALATELTAGDFELHQPVTLREDGLRGFEVRDVDGYVLFFGRPVD